MKVQNTNRMLVAAAGACMALASIASAQGGAAGNGGLVNISGATLLENWTRSVASTADYIDADGDGIAGYLNTNLDGVPFGRADQLAVGGFTGQLDTTFPFTETQHFVINYRVTGSTNGFVELLNFGGPAFVTDTAGDILTIDANNNGLLDAGDAFTDINGDAVFQSFTGVNFAGAAQAAAGLNNVNRGRASTAYINRSLYIGNSTTPGVFPGVRTGAYNQGNPGGSPTRSNITNLRATFSTTTDAPSSGGFRIDISPLDVGTFLAVRKEPAGFTTAWNRNSADAGYGANAKRSINKQGTNSVTNANFDNRLPALPITRNLNEPFIDTNLNGLRDANESFTDSNQNGVYNAPTLNATVFDTALLFAPIAMVTNFGTGWTTVRNTEIQFLVVTGRAPSGENLMVVTRDKGSGTRNAFDNTNGVDPSWGNGENIGLQSNTGNQHTTGPNFIPSNKGSNGGVETTVQNVRLAVGYVGTERGVTGSGDGSWLVPAGGNQELEILSTINDIYPGNNGIPVRPTLFNLLNNNANGWIIGGEAVLATIGDAKANGAVNGGTGWVGAFDPFVDTNNDGIRQSGETFTDLNGNGIYDATNAEAGLFNFNPPMLNVFAAQYLNNIDRSIRAFQNVPGALEDVFMPGEFAASQFISLGALEFSKNSGDYTNIGPNPILNPRLKNYILSGAAGNVHTNPAFASFNTSGRGIVPRRETGQTYLDGVSGGNNWFINEKAPGVNNDQNRVIYGSLSGMNPRNKISGDFNGSGARDLGDVAEMIKAFRQRFPGGPAFDWVPLDGIYGSGNGLEASIEILGDFNADGNFNSADVRYYADGLFLVAGNLDRKAGFIEVDAQSLAIRSTLNFFGTTLANPLATYKSGDSRADVSNSGGQTTPGFAPIGADRNNAVVDADDNRIDASDIDYVYRQFQSQGRSAAVFGVTDNQANWSNLNEAAYFDLSADLNSDLVVDQFDICEILTVLETTYGDVNLNGVVDAADAAIITANLNTAGGWARGDMNGDGLVNIEDQGFTFECNPSACPVCPADYNQDGGVTGDDIAAFFADFEDGDGCADTNLDGGITGDDIAAFFAAYETGGC